MRDFSRLVQTWCRGGSGLFFGHRLAGAQKPKTGVGNPFFRVQKFFFGENMVLRFHFLVLRFHFLGLRSVDEISARFPRNCQRNPKW